MDQDVILLQDNARRHIARITFKYLLREQNRAFAISSLYYQTLIRLNVSGAFFRVSDYASEGHATLGERCALLQRV